VIQLRLSFTLLAGLMLFSSVEAGSLEQRLQKVERQMSRLSTLMLEVQELRADLQQNFGAVEEMVHQQQQLKKQQSSQYLDLEARIRKLESTRKQRTVPTEVARPVARQGQSSEYETYNKAFALVRANKSKEALVALNKLVKKYPNGEYAGDAWYWMGRLYTVTSDKKQAKRAFAQAKTILGRTVKRSPGTPQAERAAAKLKKIP
jgi:TolA-binding protein